MLEGNTPLTGLFVEGTRSELIGKVAVDSGELMIIDPHYLTSANQRIVARIQERYEEEMRLALAATQGGELPPLHSKMLFVKGHEGAAVLFSPGVGDGFYPVYAFIAEIEGMGERIIAVLIDFLDHPWLAPLEPETPTPQDETVEEAPKG